jgi:autotransporter-associated beta strand protein
MCLPRQFFCRTGLGCQLVHIRMGEGEDAMKYGRTDRQPGRLKAALAAAAIAFICCQGTMAATYTFNAGSVNFPPNTYIPSWAYPFNWDGFSVPPSSNSSDIVFNPPFGSGLFAIQDIANPLNLHSITFNAPYTIDGGVLRWDAAGSIHNNSALTLINPLVLNNEVTYDGAGSALLAGAISGSGSMRKDGSGNVNLAGATSNFGSLFIWGGNVGVNGGSLTLSSPAASLYIAGLSTTPMTVAGGATLDTTAGVSEIFGSSSSSVSTLTITGAGTTWRAGQVRDGWGGVWAAQITVEAGASIDTGDLYISSNVASSRFLVQSAGTATVGYTYIGGDFSNGGGAATVTGPGSVWTIKNGLDIGGSNFHITDGAAGQVTINDHGTVVSKGDTKLWGIGAIAMNGGNLTTGSLSGNGVVDMGASGSSNLTINGAAGSWIYNGQLAGAGNLIKTGGSTQNLNNASNFNGAVTVNGGTLWMFSGAATSYTANNGGILNLNFSNFGNNSLVANPGGTIKYSGGLISGGFLNGAGTHDISSVSTMAFTTLGIDVQLQPTAPLQLLSVTNSGLINNPAGTNLTWGTGTNTADGRLIVNGTVDVNQLTNNGQITVQAGAALNNSFSALVLGPQSRTFVGSAAVPGGTISLGGQTLEVGGLVVNNGTINGTTNINSGGLVQGGGNFGPINVLAGGKISPGNSPGRITSGSATWGSDGTYVFEMNDAAGIAGVNWDQWNINGDLSITAGGLSDRFVIDINSLGGKGGNAAGFIKEENYSWFIGYALSGINNFDTRRLLIDSSRFTNPTAGTFSLSRAGNNLYLNYTSSIAPPQWNVDADGSWSTPDNWLPVGAPNGSTALANFLGKTTDPHTVTLDGDKTVSTIFFDNIYAYTIAPGSGGTLTIGDGLSGTINVISGAHTITAPLAFSGNVTKTGQGGLTIGGPQNHNPGASLTVRRGQLDLNSDAGTAATAASATVARLSLTINNSGNANLGADQDLRELSVNTADPGEQSLDLHLHAVRVYSSDLALTKSVLYGALKSAHASGADFHDGIYDTGPSANPTYLPIGLARLSDAHGQEMILIRATVIGDLNLDGMVTISDFIDLASNFGQAATWQEGDVNYDGQVTISDFIDLASNFGTTFTGDSLPVSPQDRATLDNFADSIGAKAIPEPGVYLSVLLVAPLIVARCGGNSARRRRGNHISA